MASKREITLNDEPQPRNIQRAESTAGLRGPSVPLEPEVVKHINVTTGKTSGSVGMFKSGKDLEWPLTLEDDRFENDRKAIDKLVQEVVRQAQYNKVQSKTYSQLDRSVRTMRQNLKGGVNDIEPNDYIASVRYLNQLQDSLRVLKEGGYEGAEAMIYYGLPGPYNDEVEDRIFRTIGQVMKRVKRSPVR